MNTTRDLQMPSGSEVESAVLHPPLHGSEVSVTSLERSGWRGKLDGLKSRGQSKVHDLQRVALQTRSSMRDGMRNGMTQVQTSMRTSPMKWAGIAAGTGFALGMIGRIAHWRSKHRNVLPSLVVIETGC